MSETTHFYVDWKFWSAVAAWIALLLTQLPPLRALFRRAKLDAETSSRIVLDHKVGNANAALNLVLTNVGGRELKIREIALLFRRGAEEFRILAQSYFLSTTDKSQVLFSPFKLKPGQEWVYVVQCFQQFSRDEEQRFRQIQSDLRQDINEKLAALTNPNPKGPPLAADDKYVQPLLDFFQAKFRWFPGEYEMVLQIKTEPSRASINKRYRLTLFESESKELADRRDNYKYGFGVYIDIPGLVALGIPFTEA